MNSKMKNVLKLVSIIALVCVVFFGLFYITIPQAFRSWYIEQHVSTTGCCEAGLFTYVWHNGDIVKSYYCPISKITDSTKINQMQAAKLLIKQLTSSPK